MNIIRTYIEINSSSFKNNINQIKKIINPDNLALVVKGNAYGHGMLEIAKIADNIKNIDLICTAGLEEAVTLKKSNIKKPILVLSYLDYDISEAINFGICLTVCTIEDLININQIATQIKIKANIHLKVDTGMSRLGLFPEEAISFINQIKKLNYINIIGIFTHLCDTSNPDTSFSFKQLDKFDNLIQNLKNQNIKFKYVHAQSSSSLYFRPKNNYNLIRIGALAYGLFKSEIHKNLILKQYPNLNIQSIMKWKTRILQIKTIPANSSIGYNRSHKTKSPKKIAILPIGYSDGYNRQFSNAAHVLVKNQKAPIIGLISMNLTSIDVTNIKNVSINDEVTLLDGSLGLAPHQILTNSKNLISNEIATQINPKIPRIII